jgi:hypothetical protein
LIQAQLPSTSSKSRPPLYSITHCFRIKILEQDRMSYYLAIVSPLDIPLYEIQFQSHSTSSTPTNNGFPSWSSFTTSSGGDLNEEKSLSTPLQGSSAPGPGIERHLAQMIAFASLDSVDELLEGTGNLYVYSSLS